MPAVATPWPTLHNQVIAGLVYAIITMRLGVVLKRHCIAKRNAEMAARSFKSVDLIKQLDSRKRFQSALKQIFTPIEHPRPRGLRRDR
jgi:hypothetical protein